MINSVKNPINFLTICLMQTSQMEQILMVDGLGQLESEKQYEIGSEYLRIESWENGMNGSATIVQVRVYHHRIF